ncbi:MAG: radical SAM protein [Clostridia bacterium]|nr:radical SAM protein [Clostridia bacterium]
MNCNICPRNCNINRDKTAGFCGATNTVKVARASLHFWEEPCISGTNGSGTVFFSGCNLRCCYCQNEKISQLHYGKEITVKELADIFIKLQESKAHNINLVTPSHYLLQITKALDLVKDKLKIPVVYNCGGYEKASSLKYAKDYINVYLTDIKYFDNNLAKKYSNAPDYFETAISALDEMLSQKPKNTLDQNGLLKSGVIVRHMVLPSHKDDSIKLLRYLKERYGTDKFILSLMSQYTPYKELPFKELNRKITSLEYIRVIDEALNLGFTDSFMQDRKSAQKIYTPPFDLTGI